MVVVVVVVCCLPIRFDVGGIHLVSDESRDVTMGQRLHQAHGSINAANEHNNIPANVHRSAYDRRQCLVHCRHCRSQWLTYVCSCPLFSALSIPHIVVNATLVNALGAVSSLRGAVLVGNEPCNIPVFLDMERQEESSSSSSSR